MKRATAEERALARASMYRLLSLAFSYPTKDVHAQLEGALEVARVGATLVSDEIAAGVKALERALAGTGARDLERSHQTVFTLSYSEDCPPYETAFSASHVFQQTQHQADVSGFYRAFGVRPDGDRPDHLAVELEFAYLLALKEARAREEGDRSGLDTTRAAHRTFLREHLARWAPLIAGRVVLAGGRDWHTAAGRLLAEFIGWEERFLRIGRVDRYRDEPAPPEPTEADGCPLDECPPFLAPDPEPRHAEIL
ncbi:MAG: molecular chaperone TorD family protein [Acidimicrobiia bacterium]